MAIVRWDPFKDFLSLHDRVNRAFEDTWGDGSTSLPDLLGKRAWAPAIDVYETEKELVVKAELPGLTSKDVEISVDDDHLIITGEKKFEDEVKEDNFYRMERRYGTFERHVPLPAAVEKNKIDATYKKGVLEVHLPKEEVRKPAKVKVEVKEA